MTHKKFGKYAFLFLAIGIFYVLKEGYFLSSKNILQQSDEDPYVNVYNWYAVIPQDVLKEFEEETGIKIRYDLYDNNEILEAKLLSGNSGYDVIFPSASPYVIRHIQADMYERLDKSLLPNFKYVDQDVNEKLRFADPELDHAIAYYWGTFGFLYVEEEILKRFPNAPVDSYRLLFDPEVVSKFSDCGVTLLDEAVDVYPQVLTYLGKDPRSENLQDLEEAQEHLLKVRPYIKRFSSLRFLNEIVSGESCLAQAWSGEAQAAQERADEVGRKVHMKYTVPKEGGVMWIDVVAIPKGAPHLKNAHLFINFLLRPDISARVTNATNIAVANTQSLEFVHEKLLNDSTVFPPRELLQKLELDRLQEPDYERKRTRYWTQVRVGNVS